MPKLPDFLHPDFVPLYDQELPAIQERQRMAGIARSDDPDAQVPATVGIGLSGGGIRSATFSLGIFQSLARLQMLRQVDWLSTVSGGGYFGAFLGRLFTRSSDDLKAAIGEKLTNDTRIVEQVETALAQPDSHPNHWLRENGRFLAPNGTGNLLLGYAIVLRNWVAIHVVLASFLFWANLSWQLVRFETPVVLDDLIDVLRFPEFSTMTRLMTDIESSMPVDFLWWSPWLCLPLLLFLLGVFPLGWGYWLVQSSKERRDNYWGLAHWIGLVVLAVLMAIELYCLWPITLSDKELQCCRLALPITLLTLLFYFLANRRPKPRKSENTPQASAADDSSPATTVLQSREIQDQLSEAAAARTRNRLSGWLADSLTILLGLVAWGVIDSFGQTLYAIGRQRDLSGGWWISLGFALLNAGALLAQKLSPFFGGEKGQRRPGGLLRFGGSLAALGLAVVSLSILSALAHGAVWGWQEPARDPGKKLAKHWREFSESVNLIEAEKKGSSSTAPTVANEAQQSTPSVSKISRRDLWGMWIVSLIVSLAFARLWPFLNRSTLQSLYNSRLRRAYLGASNPKRWKYGLRPVIHAIDGDGLLFRDYKPHQQGGPLHLINVTVNETIDGRSQVQQQDRHGVGMAVGPFGISLGVQHHAAWCNGDMLLPQKFERKKFQVFEDRNHPLPTTSAPQATPIPAESLELSEWAGISGAAFSTGLGMRTSLSLSLLAGFFNVRLGYWWDSGVNPNDREPRVESTGLKRAFALLNKVFPIPLYLLDEFTARFHGTARQRWYLTDGGHFENMAGYELIRRRVPLIVIVDGEEDSRYTFEGLANLVRKAHVDFDADIRFWNADEIEQRLGPGGTTRFGTLDALRRTFSGNRSVDKVVDGLGVAVRAYSHRHAAIATVRYDASRSKFQPDAVGLQTDASELQAEDSLLIYIKATITDDEPADVRQYSDEHPAFPHEPTIDQFFDEAQWESYRKLGDHIGWLLFNTQGSPPPSDGKGTGDGRVVENPDRPKGPWPKPPSNDRLLRDRVSDRIADRLALLITKPTEGPAAPIMDLKSNSEAASMDSAPLPRTTNEDSTSSQAAKSPASAKIVSEPQSVRQINLPPARESPAESTTNIPAKASSSTAKAKPPQRSKRRRRR